MGKICNKCGAEKPLAIDWFGIDRKSKDGFNNICKSCKREAGSRYYKQNKEAFKEKQSKYREENRKIIREKSRRRYKENIESEHKRSKRYRDQNKEKERVRQKIYREKNKEKEYNRQKKWETENIDKVRKRRREWKRNKSKEDVYFRMVCNLRRRVNHAVFGETKPESTAELLGCSVEFLKKHLESQFTEGMTWDNYGLKGWHIDHIKPCASFDLTDDEQMKECFHYTNLQPLWAEENIRKSDNLNYKIKSS